jgi:phospholipid/cholesterol/gamma-HCH transport system substrate-binding protein
MTLRNMEIRVGLVVIAAVLIFLFSLLWVKSFRLNHDRYDLTIVFSTVGGLTVGDPVHVSGVMMGNVKEVRLQATDVQVIVSVDGTVRLSTDSQFSIQNMGLMGEKFVAIEPGQGTEWLVPGQTVAGGYQAGMSEVMGEVAELLRLVKDVATTLHVTVGNPEARASIRESLENIHKFSEILASLVDQQEGDLGGALRDLRSASRGFRELVESNRDQLDSTLDQFHRASKDLEQLTRQLSEVSAAFKRIAGKVERGEGALGGIVQDEALYHDIKKTVQNLDELISDIKAHPKRYLKLELF